MSYLRNRPLDQARRLGSGTLVKSLFVWLLLLAASALAADSDAPARPAWVERLEQHLADLDEVYLGELGVFVKDLDTGVSVSLRAEEDWYLASGIKLPVAIQVMRNIEMGEFSLDTGVHLVESDYVDGAGQTNWHGPGSKLTVRFLLEQMITVSDNTATDILIRLVGLDEVNDLVRELVPEGFGNITTLKDVRRHAYSGFHPDAFQLTGKDFFVLKRQSDERLRIEALGNLLGVTVDEFALQDLSSAFEAYYATNLNGARLSAYGQLLESLVEGRALRPESTQYLMDLLLRVKTGEQRIRAGLPDSVAFAHKTGTQHLRACDLGVALGEGESGARVVIAACNRGFPSLSAAEAAFRAVGKAVAVSGVLDPVDRRHAGR